MRKMNGENTNGPLAVTSLLSSPLKGKGQGEELGKGLSKVIVVLSHNQ